MPTFPTQPALLTNEWLTWMLRSAGELTDAQAVRDFATRSIGDGVGMVGQVLRVDLTYQGDGPAAPASVVMKFAHELEANRAIGNGLRIYRTEVTFYNRIAGSLEVPKPACYFAAVAEETGEFLVVLEDPRGYRAGDQLAGVGLDGAKLVMDAVTPLHAAYWDNTGQDFLRDAMRVSSTWMEAYMPSVEGSWRSCVERFGYCIPDDVERSLADYVAGLRRLHAIMGDRTQTLLHGDPRLDNVMFNEGDQGPPVVLLDWQTVMISNPLHDLALLLSMSVTTDTRRAIEDDMVRYYHSRLVGLGVSDYSLQQCFEDYDLAVLYMMSVALVLGGAFQPANERGRRLAEEVLRRSCAAVVDRGMLERIRA